jgi:hypothetical protein
MAVDVPYALKYGANVIKATVTATTAAKMNHVQVRIDEGLQAGVELEVPSIRILETWQNHRADELTLVPTASFRDVLWIPEVGDVVECDDTGTLEWTVESINVRADEVVVSSTPFSRPMRRPVSLAKIHPIDVADQFFDHVDLDEFEATEIEVEPAVEEPEPEPPADETEPIVRRVDPDLRPRIVARRFMFGPTACSQYRQLETGCRPGDEAKRMRREIRRDGDVRRLKPWDRRHVPGEYIRYWVRGRFEVILMESPSTYEGDIHVDRIELLRRRGRQSQGRRQKH